MLVVEISTLIGILMTYVFPCLICGILEYVICKKAYKYALILPIVTLIYFLIMIFYGYSILAKLGINIQGFIFGIFIMIAFASLFITTSTIYMFFRRKKKNNLK